jgi:hypothetical protein
LATFGENFDEIIDYLFENWFVVQNLKDKISSETALKISTKAIYYAHKLKISNFGNNSQRTVK